MATLKAIHIDSINIGLIVVSLILAYWLPFELFLFSYAVLGPLHYATEINWLHGKYFFSENRSQKLILVIVATLVSLPFILKMPFINTLAEWPVLNLLVAFVKKHTGELLLISFLIGVGSIVRMSRNSQWIFLFFALAITYSLSSTFGKTGLWVALFLPTLIHVYVFTLLFMLYGAFKSQSKVGVWAFAFALAVPFFIAWVPIPLHEYPISTLTKTAFDASGMSNVSQYLAKWYLGFSGENFPLLSLLGLKIQVFIAFCYTYHYLNWFSKTTLIGWHKNLNSKRSVTIALVWGCSVGLYIYDYAIGLSALFFLSLLHVLLEFPLNALTIKALFKKMIYNEV
ncbi:MAG: hypothetical protein CFE24_11130 [Flavobacterium sp. BFFFF2]|nr:MAG: hypothetical protein CFE24_11130 [Flavobacterium sp. BFFFF2]